jgi:hypothetical protein
MQFKQYSTASRQSWSGRKGKVWLLENIIAYAALLNLVLCVYVLRWTRAVAQAGSNDRFQDSFRSKDDRTIRVCARRCAHPLLGTVFFCQLGHGQAQCTKASAGVKMNVAERMYSSSRAKCNSSSMYKQGTKNRTIW